MAEEEGDNEARYKIPEKVKAGGKFIIGFFTTATVVASIKFFAIVGSSAFVGGWALQGLGWTIGKTLGKIPYVGLPFKALGKALEYTGAAASLAGAATLALPFYSTALCAEGVANLAGYADFKDTMKTSPLVAIRSYAYRLSGAKRTWGKLIKKENSLPTPDAPNSSKQKKQDTTEKATEKTKEIGQSSPGTKSNQAQSNARNDKASPSSVTDQYKSDIKSATNLQEAQDTYQKHTTSENSFTINEIVENKDGTKTIIYDDPRYPKDATKQVSYIVDSNTGELLKIEPGTAANCKIPPQKTQDGGFKATAYDHGKEIILHEGRGTQIYRPSVVPDTPQSGARFTSRNKNNNLARQTCA
jgi:hypothetical protein